MSAPAAQPNTLFLDDALFIPDIREKIAALGLCEIEPVYFDEPESAITHLGNAAYNAVVVFEHDNHWTHIAELAREGGAFFLAHLSTNRGLMTLHTPVSPLKELAYPSTETTIEGLLYGVNQTIKKFHRGRV